MAFADIRYGQLWAKLAERGDGMVEKGALVRGYQQYTINLNAYFRFVRRSGKIAITDLIPHRLLSIII